MISSEHKVHLRRKTSFGVVIALFLALNADTANGQAIGLGLNHGFSELSNVSPPDIRFSWKGNASRYEAEAGYNFQHSARGGDDQTFTEKPEETTHYLRLGLGSYQYKQGSIIDVYVGFKLFYQMLKVDSKSGGFTTLSNINHFGGGPALGLEKELTDGLSLAGELHALYGYAISNEKSMGSYRETYHSLGTATSLVFRWRFGKY